MKQRIWRQMRPCNVCQKEPSQLCSALQTLTKPTETLKMASHFERSIALPHLNWKSRAQLCSSVLRTSPGEFSFRAVNCPGTPELEEPCQLCSTALETENNVLPDLSNGHVLCLKSRSPSSQSSVVTTEQDLRHHVQQSTSRVHLLRARTVQLSDHS